MERRAGPAIRYALPGRNPEQQRRVEVSCIGGGGTPLGPSRPKLKEDAMTEQAFVDGLLWVFGVIGGLMAVFFLVLLICFIGHEITWSIQERRRQRRIQSWRAEQWQMVRRKS